MVTRAVWSCFQESALRMFSRLQAAKKIIKDSQHLHHNRQKTYALLVYNRKLGRGGWGTGIHASSNELLSKVCKLWTLTIGFYTTINHGEWIVLRSAEASRDMKRRYWHIERQTDKQYISSRRTQNARELELEIALETLDKLMVPARIIPERVIIWRVA